MRAAWRSAAHARGSTPSPESVLFCRQRRYLTTECPAEETNQLLRAEQDVGQHFAIRAIAGADWRPHARALAERSTASARTTRASFREPL